MIEGSKQVCPISFEAHITLPVGIDTDATASSIAIQTGLAEVRLSLDTPSANRILAAFPNLAIDTCISQTASLLQAVIRGFGNITLGPRFAIRPGEAGYLTPPDEDIDNDPFTPPLQFSKAIVKCKWHSNPEYSTVVLAATLLPAHEKGAD